MQTDVRCGRAAAALARCGCVVTAVVCVAVILNRPALGDESPAISPARPARLAAIPPEAEISFHRRGHIHVMNADGGGVTQVTFDQPRHYEHVAVSHDRKRIAANYFADPALGPFSSRVIVFDLAASTEAELVPQFETAGMGGVDWDPKGFVYFTARAAKVYPDAQHPEQHMANMAAFDIYKVRYDGTGLQRVTHTTDRGEADVSVSPDGTLIAYMATRIRPAPAIAEIWVNDADGADARLIYEGGPAKIAGVHDPEISPDNRRVVFSKVNPDYKNFPDHPKANTAHDIYRIKIDGSGLTRLTTPGPISIIPDWKNDTVLYLELNDQQDVAYRGLSAVRFDATEQRRLLGDAQIGKWIP